MANSFNASSAALAPSRTAASGLTFDMKTVIEVSVLRSSPTLSSERSPPSGESTVTENMTTSWPPTGKAPDHDTVYSAVVWMMLGLPQMQGSDLDETVGAPITFRLTGAGASEWTVHRGDPSGALTVEETGGADVVVTSDADAFIAWGTQRRRWRTDCTIEGDASLAVPLLDALNIV